MKIIIPMASTDQDMLENYSTIKPLVKLGNKTMVEMFVKNFGLNCEYIFLCKQQDLIETELLSVIQNLKVKKKIVGITKNTSSVLETVFFANKHVKKKDSILRIVEFLNLFFPLKIDKQKLENCLRTTSFKYLSSMEESGGFGESVSSKDEKKIQFFNKGLVDNWKNILSPKISNEIEMNFKNEMTELGYV